MKAPLGALGDPAGLQGIACGTGAVKRRAPPRR